jgi:hypothetical protein
MQFTVTEVAFAATAFGAVLGPTSSKILDLASAAYKKISPGFDPRQLGLGPLASPSDLEVIWLPPALAD